MKALAFIGLFGVLLFISSCKEDVPPTLVVNVEDSTGVALYKARIFTHPCFDGVSCDTSRIDQRFVNSALTNGSGQATFKFPYSAIIDVAAQWTDCDTPDVYCLYVGKTVARFETKRLKKGEDNQYSVTVTLYPE